MFERIHYRNLQVDRSFVLLLITGSKWYNTVPTTLLLARRNDTDEVEIVTLNAPPGGWLLKLTGEGASKYSFLVKKIRKRIDKKDSKLDGDRSLMRRHNDTGTKFAINYIHLISRETQRGRKRSTYVSIIDIVARSLIRPRFVSRIILLASIPFLLHSYIIYRYDLDGKENMIDIVSQSEKKLA